DDTGDFDLSPLLDSPSQRSQRTQDDDQVEVYELDASIVQNASELQQNAAADPVRAETRSSWPILEDFVEGWNTKPAAEAPAPPAAPAAGDAGDQPQGWDRHNRGAAPGPRVPAAAARSTRRRSGRGRTRPERSASGAAGARAAPADGTAGAAARGTPRSRRT